MTPQYPDPTDDVWLRLWYGRMLDMKDDWDGEGSPGYSIDTLRTAVAICRYLQDITGIEFWQDIGPGPHGSIDIHHRVPGKFNLLMNVETKEENYVFGYYGETFDDAPYTIDSNDWVTTSYKYSLLLSWLQDVK